MNKAFTPFTWQDEPNHSTPLSAENLNKLNTAIDTIDDRVVSHDTTIGTLQPKSDNSLSTSSHTVVGAINEINAWSLAVVDGELCIKYEEV